MRLLTRIYCTKNKFGWKVDTSPLLGELTSHEQARLNANILILDGYMKNKAYVSGTTISSFVRDAVHDALPERRVKFEEYSAPITPEDSETARRGETWTKEICVREETK